MKRMLMAVVAATFCTTAAAETFTFDISKAYGGLMGSYLITDSARTAGHGYGGQMVLGLPISENLNFELNAFGDILPRRADDTSDLLYGLGADLLLVQRAHVVNSFLLVGAGVEREDIQKVESIAPFINGGVGFIAQTPVPNLSLRAEARMVVNINDKATLGLGGDYAIDGRLSAGLLYGFGLRTPEVPPSDTDGDGVFDPSDLCPGTPPGTVVDASGCPLAPADTDGDGVVDTLDQCPGTPAGEKVDERGCTLAAPVGNPDEDGDGVLNTIDQCPSTPNGFKVDGVGCMVEQTVALQSVNFEFGADTLTVEARAILDGIAKSLLAQTAVKVQVSGHTDSLGPQSYNLTLSQNRAKSVQAYLLAAGVGAERLSAEGEGEFSPIASNDDEAGRAKNRRVEFKILTQ